MNTQEWALVIFTILAQMSVGAFLVLGFVHFFAARKAGAEEADKLSDRALLVIGPILVLGLIASLFHLGNPLNAFKAVTNVGSSWLSREILSGVIFAVLGGVFAIMQWRKIGTFAARNIIAILAALVGIFLVYSMSSVYMMPTQPAWDNVFTPISFFTTTLLLGVLVVGTAFIAGYAFLRRKSEEGMETQAELLRGMLRWFALATVILLGVQLVTAPIYVATLASAGGAALKSVDMLLDDYLTIFILRLVLVFIGAGIFALFLYRGTAASERVRALSLPVYAAFIFVLAAEVLGRFLFYATQVSVGL
jgi:anaerobic dimethyl sulfoxide reductase subunit C (anchor subunit)